MNKYKVYIYIAGAPHRPPYQGYVDVWAENDEEAGKAAIQKLKRGAFQDVWYDAFKVRRIERIFS